MSKSSDCVVDITKRLGLRGFIVRGGEKWKTDEIKALQRDITKLNKKFFHLTKEEMRGDVVAQFAKKLLDLHGPLLWPEPNSNKENDRQWLYKAPCDDAPDYTLNLVYSLHKDRIEPIFVHLLIAKCINYRTNRNEDGICLNSASLRDTVVRPNTGSKERKRANSVTSELTEYTTDEEDDADSVLGDMRDTNQHPAGADNNEVWHTPQERDVSFQMTTRSRATPSRSKPIYAGRCLSLSGGAKVKATGPLTLLMVFKLPADKLGAIATGPSSLSPAAIASYNETGTTVTMGSSRKRPAATDPDNEAPVERHRLPPPSPTVRVSKPVTSSSRTSSGTGDVGQPEAPAKKRRRRYIAGGRGGGGRYVDVPDSEHNTDTSAGPTDGPVTEPNTAAPPFQNVVQAGQEAADLDHTAPTETASLLRDTFRPQPELETNRSAQNVFLWDPYHPARERTSSQVLASEYSLPSFPTGSSFANSIHPNPSFANAFPAFSGSSTGDQTRPFQSSYQSFASFPATSETTLSRAVMQHQDFKIAPRKDDDEVEITEVRRVEHRQRLSTFGLSTPDNSRRASSVKDHSQLQRSVLGSGTGMNSRYVSVQQGSYGEDDKPELQQRLSKTSLLLRSHTCKSQVVEPAAFKHCSIAEEVRQTLERYMIQCIGVERMVEAEKLLILLYQVDQNRKKVEKYKYRIPIRESFEDGWDLVSDGLTELDINDGEKFLLSMTILMEGEE